MSTLTLWMIEDNRTFRSSAIRALRECSDFRQVQPFECCEEALEAVDLGGRPDVVLLDLGLPGMGGLEGISQLKARLPDLVVLILTVFEDDDKIFRALCSGASGYLLKGEPIQREDLQIVRHDHRGHEPSGERLRVEHPIELLRIVSSNGRILRSVDDWPASIEVNVGRKMLVVTTLGAPAWLRPRTNLDQIYQYSGQSA